MPGAVPAPVIRQRCAEIHERGAVMARAFRQPFLGRDLAVLWDGQIGAAYTGLSDNYLRVRLDSARVPGLSQSPALLARVTRTRITGIDGTTLVGIPCEGPSQGALAVGIGEICYSVV